MQVLFLCPLGLCANETQHQDVGGLCAMCLDQLSHAGLEDRIIFFLFCFLGS